MQHKKKKRSLYRFVVFVVVLRFFLIISLAIFLFLFSWAQHSRLHQHLDVVSSPLPRTLARSLAIIIFCSFATVDFHRAFDVQQQKIQKERRKIIIRIVEMKEIINFSLADETELFHSAF